MDSLDFRFKLIAQNGAEAKSSVYAQLAKVAQSYKLLTELKKNEVSNFPEVKAEMIDILVKNDISRLEVPGHDPEKSVVVAKGWETKGASTAINSAYYYGTYSHPLTQPGLHIRTKSAEAGQQSNVGYIHFGFDPDILDTLKANRANFFLASLLVPAAPAADNHNPWAEIVNELDFWRFKHIGMGKYGKRVVVKHKFIDWIVRGHTVHVWCGLGEDKDQYVVTLMMEWMNAPERALKISAERLDAARKREQGRRDYVEANRMVIEGTTAPAPADKETGEVKLLAKVLRQSKRVDLLKVPQTAVILYDMNGGYLGPDNWDPNNAATVERFRGNDQLEGIVNYAQIKIVS